MRWLLLALALALSCWPARARAAPTSVVVEIDLAAERIVDARSARRLVPLELSDVAVPPSNSGARSLTPVLFFRVLGRSDGGLRVELWERGEFHGSRTLLISRENPQLVSRRVALVAAELGRRLARKRQAALGRSAQLHARQVALLKQWRARTQDGPRALRAELAFGAVPERAWLLGSRLTGEVSLAGSLRLDLGAELLIGELAPELVGSVYGVSAGPAYRLSLSPRLDLDLGLDLAALLLRAPGAVALDDRFGQEASWTARARGSARLELRLSRDVRASLGAELGGLLRAVPYETAQGARDRLQGPWLGAALGLVLTPAL